MIRKYKHKWDIPNVKGHVISNRIKIKNGYLVEYLKIPGEWAK